MSSALFSKSRSHGKIAMQVRSLFIEVSKNPAVKIDIWSPNELHASRLIGVADRLGFDLELTIPKRHSDTDLWVSKLHSIKQKAVV